VSAPDLIEIPDEVDLNRTGRVTKRRIKDPSLLRQIEDQERRPVIERCALCDPDLDGQPHVVYEGPLFQAREHARKHRVEVHGQAPVWTRPKRRLKKHEHGGDQSAEDKAILEAIDRNRSEKPKQRRGPTLSAGELDRLREAYLSDRTLSCRGLAEAMIGETSFKSPRSLERVLTLAFKAEGIFEPGRRKTKPKKIDTERELMDAVGQTLDAVIKRGGGPGPREAVQDRGPSTESGPGPLIPRSGTVKLANAEINIEAFQRDRGDFVGQRASRVKFRSNKRVTENEILDLRRRYEAGERIAVLTAELHEQWGFKTAQSMTMFVYRVFHENGWPLHKEARARANAEKESAREAMLLQLRSEIQAGETTIYTIAKDRWEELGFDSRRQCAVSLRLSFTRRGWAVPKPVRQMMTEPRASAVLTMYEAGIGPSAIAGLVWERWGYKNRLTAIRRIRAVLERFYGDQLLRTRNDGVIPTLNRRECEELVRAAG
jgi:hypothetical protein